MHDLDFQIHYTALKHTINLPIKAMHNGVTVFLNDAENRLISPGLMNVVSALASDSTPSDSFRSVRHRPAVVN